jgi:hypothetical protein
MAGVCAGGFAGLVAVHWVLRGGVRVCSICIMEMRKGTYRAVERGWIVRRCGGSWSRKRPV